MRGTVAKRLRREVNQQEFPLDQPQYGKLATGARYCLGARRAYLDAKTRYKQEKH
jgi:hypothetical protein